MTNPIHKRFQRFISWNGQIIPKRIWSAFCPECGQNVPIDPYSTPTRKTARDALHRHNRKKHTPPRSG